MYISMGMELNPKIYETVLILALPYIYKWGAFSDHVIVQCFASRNENICSYVNMFFTLDNYDVNVNISP